jgi:hypothetical protein
LWIVTWHYEQVALSLLVMVALLVTLVAINRTLQLSRLWIPRLAFGIYLGWICLAIVANVTALLVSIGWGGWGIAAETWAIVMIAAGAAIGGAVMLRLQNPFLALALIWGFYGIVLKRQTDSPAIATAGQVGMALVAGMLIYVLINGRQKKTNELG